MKPIKLQGGLGKNLFNRGIPRDVMRMAAYDLNHHATTIESQTEGMKLRKISKKTQLEGFQHLLDKPFGRPYIFAISSSPNDGKAKLLAAHFIEHAIKGQLGGAFPKSTRGKQLPLWHMLTGSFQDRLRDNHTDTPSMLVLSNLTSLSTNVKLEKCRDLLEQFNNIPRILVIAGEDPVTFCNQRLFIAANHVVHLSTARKIIL